MSENTPPKASGRRIVGDLQTKAKMASLAQAAQEDEDPNILEHEAQAPHQRVDLRGEVRPNMAREEDSRTRAARRTAELLEHGDTSEDSKDKFFVDPKEIPAGWTYEWKRNTIYGAEDPANQVRLARAGWEPVPTSRHPHMMPAGDKYAIIERDGMILMERPAVITAKAKQRDHANARAQMRGQEAKLNEAPTGQFERRTKDGSLVKINKEYERVDIPE